MSDSKRNVAIIILAAGLGTRMKSNKAKVLHELNGRAMILYVVDTAVKAVGNNVVIVVGHQADKVQQIVGTRGDLFFAYQAEQLGTGHAALCTLPQVPAECGEVVILCGDVPLLQATTIDRLISDHRRSQHDVTVLAVDLPDPTGYGRIVRDDMGRICGIVEEADATAEQKKVRTINTGIYCVKKDFLRTALQNIDTNNAQGALYLTDIVKIGYQSQKSIGVVTGENLEEFTGINTIDQLQKTENLLQNRIHIKP